jgi:hypothetical protein
MNGVVGWGGDEGRGQWGVLEHETSEDQEGTVSDKSDQVFLTFE